MITTVTDICCDHRWLTKRFTCVWKIIKIVEGYPWGTVRETTNLHGAEDEIRDFLKIDRHDFQQNRKADLKSAMSTLQQEIMGDRATETRSRLQSRVEQKVEGSQIEKSANFLNEIKDLLTSYDGKVVDFDFFTTLNNFATKYMMNDMSARPICEQPSLNGPSRQTIHEENKEDESDGEIDKDVTEEVPIDF